MGHMEKLGKDYQITPQLRGAMKTYSELVTDIASTKERIATWSSANCASELEKLRTKSERLHIAANIIGNGALAVQADLANKRTEALKVARISTLARDKAAKPFVANGLANNFARWLHHIGVAREAGTIDYALIYLCVEDRAVRNEQGTVMEER